jgi:transportin-1
MSESDIVPILLPLINENLVSDDWKHREVGILALGAIAEGCMDAIDPHLPQIIPFLLQSLQTPVPLVKAIAAWTLSRYASWIEHSRIHHTALNQTTMLALLHTMADRNKKVQRSACTALSVFGERAPETVAPQLEAIMQAVQWGLRSYQAKNLMVLYDAVGTIADGLGPERLIQLQRTNALQAILPALLEKWVNTAEDDIGLFALLECMCSLAVAMGSQMAPYAQVIVQRALSMVETTLKAAALTSGGDVDFDFCIVALDLIGGLVGGLGERMAPLLLADAHKFEALLTRCLDEPLAQVRQSALALVGDLAECCPAPLNSPTLLTVVIKAIIENVDAMQESASQGSANNAVWALGELLLCFPDMIKPHLTILLPRLCRYMQHYADNTVSRGYLENLAVTIGRAMALMPVAEFGEILGRWSTLMTHVVDQREKCSAWSPVMACLLANPMMIQPEALPKLLRSIAVFKDPPASMELAFKQLVVMCKEQLVGSMNWPQFRRTLEVPSEFDIRFGI